MRLVLTLLFLLPLVGCISYVHPQGPDSFDRWNEPLNLNLHNTSLRGLGLHVDCAIEVGKSLQNVQHPYCDRLVSRLSGYGASIDSESVDVESRFESKEEYETYLESWQKLPRKLYVRYSEPESEWMSCGLTWWLFFSSATFFPLICDYDVKARLSVMDERGVILFQEKYHGSVKNYYGVYALILIARRRWGGSEDAPYDTYGNELLAHMTNRVYSVYRERSLPGRLR